MKMTVQLSPVGATYMKRLAVYLRAYRRRWGLSQSELAILIGFNDRGMISRIERQMRRPSLSTAIACRILFGMHAIEIFPAFFADVEEAVLERVQALYDDLQGSRSRMTPAKLDFLEEVLARAKEGRPIEIPL